jgi:phosphoribosyl-AMP cyclohydrolase
LRFTGNGTAARGYVYSNSSNQIGFLDADRNWAYKLTHDSRHEFYVNTTLYSTLNTDFFEHTSDIRAPIFYENSNTAYYFDGANSGDSIRVAGDIVAYYSDERLKDKKGNISGAIDKVSKLNGFYYRANKKAQELGYDDKLQVGVSAQEVEAVLPEVVKDAPIGQGYKTVKYDRMVPLLIEAIKEQQEIINKQGQDIDELKQLVKQLMENK